MYFYSQETEKLSVNQGSSATKNFCFSVVERVFQKGTSNQPYILWNRVFDFIVNFLSNDIHANVFGTPLISMLRDFLAMDQYASVIEASHWKGADLIF